MGASEGTSAATTQPLAQQQQQPGWQQPPEQQQLQQLQQRGSGRAPAIGASEGASAAATPPPAQQQQQPGWQQSPEPQSSGGATTIGASEVARAAATQPPAQQQQQPLQQQSPGLRELEQQQAPQPDPILGDSSVCTVCMSEPRSVVLVPCWHFQMCQACAERVQATNNKVGWVITACGPSPCPPLCPPLCRIVSCKMPFTEQPKGPQTALHQQLLSVSVAAAVPAVPRKDRPPAAHFLLSRSLY